MDDTHSIGQQSLGRPTGGDAGIDLSTSLLALGNASNPKPTTRYDALAQLLSSDDESDTDLTLPKKLSQSPKASTAQPEKGFKSSSAIARLAVRRKANVVSSDSDSSDSDSSDSETPEDKPVSPSALHTNSDHSAAKHQKKAKKSPKKQAKSARAASKLAMDRIHQESARLIRETAVAMNPLEYTKLLDLPSFFARFDARAANKPKRNIIAALAKASPEPRFIHYDSDGDELEIEIVDSAPQPLGAGKVLLGKPGGKSQMDDLESILKYGSQPIHVTVNQSSAGIRRTDGSNALRELNSALLDAMYKMDMDAKKSKSAEKNSDKPTALAEGGQRAEEGDNMDEHMVSDNSSDMDDALSGSESEEAIGEEDASMDEIADSTRPISQMPHRSRAVVVSDDEDDEEGNEKPESLSKVAAAEPRPPTANKASKAKFLSMFKMPTKPSTTKQLAGPPLNPSLAQPSVSSISSQQNEMQVSTSQDLSYLFSMPTDHNNTQDSLLLTPDPISQINRDLVSESLIFDTQPTQLGIDIELNSDVQSTQSMLYTQPTQLMESAQPTQLTAATVQAMDNGAEMSPLPTMVRRALEPERIYSEHGGSVTNPSSPSPSPSPSHEGAVEPEPEQITPPHHPAGRRLIRRPKDKQPAKPSRLGRRALKSEFIEAEAEEGESSDSEAEAGVKHYKFNWANPENKADDDEDDLDMDTDEEEAALLADPMINNEVAEDNEADQAIRDLHRKQDFDQDEKDIQSLAQDIKMGRLKNRVLNRTGFALDEEDYIDRQTRAERMEERVRQRRKMLAKEIHDSNLAEIARNPETAAFAQAALMRPIAGDQSETEDMLANAFELEEEVDDRHIAMAVQHQLARSHRRIDSDVESDAEGNDGKERIRGAQRTKNRIAAKAIDSSESVQGGSGSFDFGSELGDDVDGDVFTSVAVEKLIVRRKTLMAGQDDGHSKQSGVWPAPKKTLLKRPGVSLIGASSKKSK